MQGAFQFKETRGVYVGRGGKALSEAGCAGTHLQALRQTLLSLTLTQLVAARRKKHAKNAATCPTCLPIVPQAGHPHALGPRSRQGQLACEGMQAAAAAPPSSRLKGPLPLARRRPVAKVHPSACAAKGSPAKGVDLGELLPAAALPGAGGSRFR